MRSDQYLAWPNERANDKSVQNEIVSQDYMQLSMCPWREKYQYQWTRVYPLQLQGALFTIRNSGEGGVSLLIWNVIRKWAILEIFDFLIDLKSYLLIKSNFLLYLKSYIPLSRFPLQIWDLFKNCRFGGRLKRKSKEIVWSPGFELTFFRLAASIANHYATSAGSCPGAGYHNSKYNTRKYTEISVFANTRTWWGQITCSQISIRAGARWFDKKRNAG